MSTYVLNHTAGLASATRTRASGTMSGGLLSRIAAWMKVAGERRHLANLPERMLKDIGTDRGAAAAEAARPFWDLPAGRRDLS